MKEKDKKIKVKLEKIFGENKEVMGNLCDNPAGFVERCGEKIKKAERYLEGRSMIGLYLCEEFLGILNKLVENLVNQLDRQLREI